MNNLRAALVLSLDDKLSAGLNRLKSQFENLKNLGKSLGLGKLENGASILRDNESAAHGFASSLRGVGNAADRAWASVKRMGSSTANWGKRTFGPMSRTEAFTAAAEGFSVIQPIRSFAGFENIARHSAITEGLSGSALEAETKRLMAVFRKDALATSQSSESIAQAYQDLIQTGIAPKRAEELLPIHSRAATAYNISPEALGHAVFALSDSFQIGHEDMGGALASMALASKEGRFKVEDFSRYLPSIGGNMSKLHMTGRASADLAFAALETVMKNSADPSTGATNFTDFLNYLTSPMAARSFALESHGMSDPQKKMLSKYGIHGIDIIKLLGDAREKGVDPISAVLGSIQKQLAGKPPEVQAEILGAFFHNQQARDAAQAMLQHPGDFLDMKKRLGMADDKMLDRDFASANAAPKKKLDLVGEKLTQLVQTAGEAFLPILIAINYGLDAFMSSLDWIDRKLPGLKDGVLLVTGSMLAFGATMAAVGLVAPPIKAGFALLASAFRLMLMPMRLLWTATTFVVQGLAAVIGISAGVLGAIVAIAAVIAAAAYDITTNWQSFSGFFSDLWSGIKDIFGGFADFVLGVFTLDLDRAWSGILRTFRGFGEEAGAVWGIAKQLFLDFIDAMDRWAGDTISATFNGISSAAQWGWAEAKQLFLDFSGALDGWTGGTIKAVFDGIRDAVQAVLDRIHEFMDLVNGGAIARASGSVARALGATAPTYSPAVAGASGAAADDQLWDVPGGGALAMPGIKGTITVEAAPGSRVTDTKSDTPGVTIKPADPDPGRTLGRP